MDGYRRSRRWGPFIQYAIIIIAVVALARMWMGGKGSPGEIVGGRIISVQAVKLPDGRTELLIFWGRWGRLEVEHRILEEK